MADKRFQKGSFLQRNVLDKFFPTLRSSYAVEKGILAEQGIDIDDILTEKEKESAEQNARLGIENPPEIQRKLDIIEARKAKEFNQRLSDLKGELEDNDYYSGLLASEEFESDDNENIAEELSYSLEPEDQWVQRHVDAENKGKDLAREEHLLRRGSEDTSGGMTNNAFASKSSASKISPAGKQALVGLLKDFLAPAEDAPPTQVRSAGIIRGGGTPFPSLLQKRPERKYYQNKGLV